MCSWLINGNMNEWMNELSITLLTNCDEIWWTSLIVWFIWKISRSKKNGRSAVHLQVIVVQTIILNQQGCILYEFKMITKCLYFSFIFINLFIDLFRWPSNWTRSSTRTTRTRTWRRTSNSCVPSVGRCVTIVIYLTRMRSSPTRGLASIDSIPLNSNVESQHRCFRFRKRKLIKYIPSASVPAYI